MQGLYIVVLYAIGIIMTVVAAIALGSVVPELWFAYVAFVCLWLAKAHLKEWKEQRELETQDDE